MYRKRIGAGGNMRCNLVFHAPDEPFVLRDVELEEVPEFVAYGNVDYKLVRKIRLACKIYCYFEKVK